MQSRLRLISSMSDVLYHCRSERESTTPDTCNPSHIMYRLLPNAPERYQWRRSQRLSLCYCIQQRQCLDVTALYVMLVICRVTQCVRV